jgi:diguanylate cyclase (GGDEF)-like protein
MGREAITVRISFRGQPRLVVVGTALPLVTAITTIAILLGPPKAMPKVALTVLGLIILTGVIQPVRHVSIVLAMLAVAGQVALTLPTEMLATPLSLIAAIGTLGVGLLADDLGRAARQAQADREAALAAAEELRPVDSVAGVTKWAHATLAFERELARARRYEQPLALLRVDIANWDVVWTRLGTKKSAALVGEVGAHLVSSSRIVDIVAYHGKGIFSLLLPDTPGVGALVVAQRIVKFKSVHPGVKIRVGVAPHTGEQGTVEDLLVQAETAVSMAERLDRPYAVCGVEGAVEAPERPTRPRRPLRPEQPAPPAQSEPMSEHMDDAEPSDYPERPATLAS